MAWAPQKLASEAAKRGKTRRITRASVVRLPGTPGKISASHLLRSNHCPRIGDETHYFIRLKRIDIDIAPQHRASAIRLEHVWPGLEQQFLTWLRQLEDPAPAGKPEDNECLRADIEPVAAMIIQLDGPRQGERNATDIS